jgi:hypothetical protein
MLVATEKTEEPIFLINGGVSKPILKVTTLATNMFCIKLKNDLANITILGYIYNHVQNSDP